MALHFTHDFNFGWRPMGLNLPRSRNCTTTIEKEAQNQKKARQALRMTITHTAALCYYDVSRRRVRDTGMQPHEPRIRSATAFSRRLSGKETPFATSYKDLVIVNPVPPLVQTECGHLPSGASTPESSVTSEPRPTTTTH